MADPMNSDEQSKVERVVCRFCGAGWEGYRVVQVRPTDNGDPGRCEGKTNCCDTFIREPGLFGRTREPAYAMLTEWEKGWTEAYG